MNNHEYYMQIALEEAKKAYEQGEVPVGAVLVVDGVVVAKNHNRREKEQQALNHAELLVIKESCEKQGFWRLDNSTLYSTVEPCVMCSGCAVQARIENIVYGAKDLKYGCCGSVLNLADNEKFNHRATITSGILEEQCSALMTNFFKQLREEKKKLKENRE